MKYNGIQLRREKKYLLSKSEASRLEEKLSHIMKYDKNTRDGGYFIRSLYFDDMYDSAYADKAAGILTREKYRIRLYSNGFLRLERKRKIGSMICKESLPVDREICEKIIKADPSADEFLQKYPLGREFLAAVRVKRLCPSVIVDYFRTALVYPAGNVRITFDKRLCSGGRSKDIFNFDLPTVPCFKDSTVLLEFKYDDFVPEHIRRMINPERVVYTALSKYVICRDAQFTYAPAQSVIL